MRGHHTVNDRKPEKCEGGCEGGGKHAGQNAQSAGDHRQGGGGGERRARHARKAHFTKAGPRPQTLAGSGGDGACQPHVHIKGDKPERSRKHRQRHDHEINDIARLHALFGGHRFKLRFHHHVGGAADEVAEGFRVRPRRQNAGRDKPARKGSTPQQQAAFGIPFMAFSTHFAFRDWPFRRGPSQQREMAEDHGSNGRTEQEEDAGLQAHDEAEDKTARNTRHGSAERAIGKADDEEGKRCQIEQDDRSGRKRGHAGGHRGRGAPGQKGYEKLVRVHLLAVPHLVRWVRGEIAPTGAPASQPALRRVVY